MEPTRVNGAPDAASALGIADIRREGVGLRPDLGSLLSVSDGVVKGIGGERAVGDVAGMDAILRKAPDCSEDKFGVAVRRRWI